MNTQNEIPITAYSLLKPITRVHDTSGYPTDAAYARMDHAIERTLPALAKILDEMDALKAQLSEIKGDAALGQSLKDLGDMHGAGNLSTYDWVKSLYDEKLKLKTVEQELLAVIKEYEDRVQEVSDTYDERDALREELKQYKDLADASSVALTAGALELRVRAKMAEPAVLRGQKIQALEEQLVAYKEVARAATALPWSKEAAELDCIHIDGEGIFRFEEATSLRAALDALPDGGDEHRFPTYEESLLIPDYDCEVHGHPGIELTGIRGPRDEGGTSHEMYHCRRCRLVRGLCWWEDYILARRGEKTETEENS